MNAPLIFLDINGVLNSDQTDFGPDVPPLDPVNIAPFNRIIEATSARLVITSDWRFHTSLENIASYFKEASIRGEIIDMVPDLRGGYDPPIEIEYTRGEEIDRWMDGGGEADTDRRNWHFVVLDAESDVEPFAPRHVRTDHGHGLTEVDADRVIALLQ